MPEFNKGLCVCQYGLYEKKLVFALKYNEKKHIAKDMGRMMADKLAISPLEFQVIVPVPVSRGKLKSRGYNQSYLMGKTLSKYVEKPCLEAMERIRETQAQKNISARDRADNLKGAFAVKATYLEYIKDKDILLIDDIYTTGATANECAKCLMEAGARKVNFLSFAAGANRYKDVEE
ncbi:MAG: ComF family protein [Clostridia bacterium]|nr:ComF family protein [Clostridia bacterium]